MTLRVLDLFAGACGGWSLGLHRAGGFATVAACELDPWRRAEFGRKFPGARLYDDVRLLTAGRLRADGAFPDVIVGSPPCQDASTANHKGRGLDGARTGLFFDWLRLVDECRPRWACAENVPGIRLRGIDRILEGLAAIGYACWPCVVGADDVGANHRRKRVWIVAGDTDGEHEGKIGRASCRPGAEPARDRARDAAAADTARLGQPARGDADESGRPQAAFGDGPDAHGQGQHAGAGDAAAMGRRAGAAILARDHAADADGNALWLEPGRCGRADGEGQAEPAGDARRAFADADAQGHEIGQGVKRHDGEERPAAERDRARPWAHWNGGPPVADLLDDGLSAGLDRAAAQAAFGDAVVPQIPELIGRFILFAERCSAIDLPREAAEWLPDPVLWELPRFRFDRVATVGFTIPLSMWIAGIDAAWLPVAR